MGELSRFSWRVIDDIQKLIAANGMTDAEVIVRSGIPRNTFYRKMRGETPLNLNDVDAIATALAVDPFELLARSAKAVDAERADNVTALIGPAGVVGHHQDDIDVSPAPDATLPRAAKRGTRKADQ